jgi:hypothetical protein
MIVDLLHMLVYLPNRGCADAPSGVLRFPNTWITYLALSDA